MTTANQQPETGHTIASYTVTVQTPTEWTEEQRLAWLRIGGAGLVLHMERVLDQYRAYHPEVQLTVTAGQAQRGQGQ